VSDPRLLEYKARTYAEKAAAVAEKCGIRAVIQIHGWMYPHSATAAYPLVKDLDPRYIGIKLDPGNNLHQEGYELFDYQIKLLKEYIAAIGAKSCATFRDPNRTENNGWYRIFVPSQDGEADFRFIYRCLKEVGFDGPSILMPFYEENNEKVLCEKLAGEVAYLKSCEET